MRIERDSGSAFRTLLVLVGLAVSVLLAAIFLSLLLFSRPALLKNGFRFITGTQWNPVAENFQALAFVVGTLLTSFIALAIATALSLALAILLGHYSRTGALAAVMKTAVELLAGIPSVVYGLFGLGIFVLFFKFGTSILAASLTLGIMTLPVIISTAEEALRSVPRSFRTVSISLGATQWQTIRRIVLPQSQPGILTGVILGLERAAGETAPILFTGVAFYLPTLPSSPLDPTMALPYHLYVISTQVPGMPQEIQYGTALVLLVLVLGLNFLATIIRSRARRRRQW